MSKSKSDTPMSAEDRMRLIMKPFPIVHVSTPKGNSQAPDWAKEKQDRQDREA